MSKKLRVAAIQILCHAAYIDSTTNLINEPTGTNIGLFKLSTIQTIKSLRRKTYEQYLENLKMKIDKIFEFASQKEVDLIIFPEYSIPPEFLPLIKQKAIDQGLIVVAGRRL